MLSDRQGGVEKGGQIDQREDEKQQNHPGNAPFKWESRLKTRTRRAQSTMRGERADVRVNGQRPKEQPERIQPCADQPLPAGGLQRGLRSSPKRRRNSRKPPPQSAMPSAAHSSARTARRRTARGVSSRDRSDWSRQRRGQRKEEQARSDPAPARRPERAPSSAPARTRRHSTTSQHRQQNGKKERIRRVNRTGKGGQHGRRKRHRAAEHRNQIRRGEIEQPADER